MSILVHRSTRSQTHTRHQGRRVHNLNKIWPLHARSTLTVLTTPTCHNTHVPQHPRVTTPTCTHKFKYTHNVYAHNTFAAAIPPPPGSQASMSCQFNAQAGGRDVVTSLPSRKHLRTNCEMKATLTLISLDMYRCPHTGAGPARMQKIHRIVSFPVSVKWA